MSLIRKNRSIDIDSNIKEEILSFLSSTYSAFEDNQYSIYKDKDKWIVDVSQPLIVSNYDIQYLTNGLFEFGVAKRYFDCGGCKKLESLEGGPEKVGGSFICRNCPNLKSLKGAPKEVGRNFDCSNCTNLKSLEGAPKEVKGSFICSNCPNLKSLKGAPKVIKGRFIHDEYLK